MGMEHRVGYIKTGYDADVVLWDSHPLALGATPKQVWIDGIAQLESPYTVSKPPSFHDVPEVPNFDKEAAETLQYDGLPPLEPEHVKARTVVFTNVTSVMIREAKTIKEVFHAQDDTAVVVAQDGKLACSGSLSACSEFTSSDEAEFINLEGGAVAPGLVTFGSPLGLEEIRAEASTTDGYVPDPLSEKVPAIAGGDGAFIRAADGLQYGTRDALLAYRSGVTTGITFPRSSGFLTGLSVAFSPGARHKLEKGALIQDVVAVHVGVHYQTIYDTSTSVSTQIAALRNLLLSGGEGLLGQAFDAVKKGETPLVVDVESADVMASLVLLKQEVERETGQSIKMSFSGATEAHLLAKELSEAEVGVLITRPRPFPSFWETRRILPGVPLSESNAVATLLAHNVTVAIGVHEGWMARNTRWDAAWIALETGGEMSKADALALASVNVEKLLGVHIDDAQSDLVATRGGGLLDLSSKVVGIISPRRGIVDLL